MRAEIVFSPSNNTEEAYEEIKIKLEKLTFSPKFLFLFLTAGTWKAYSKFMELLRNKFPNAKMLGCTIEGYIVENAIWTRGVAILLADFEGEVEVFWANEKSAMETIEKLGDKIGKGWDTILLVFPAFYFPGKLKFLRFFLNNKRFYRRFKGKDDVKDRRKVLLEYSKTLMDMKMVYPIDEVIKTISERSGRNTTIIGMNLMPLEATSNTPLILADFNNVHDGAAAICFKGKVNGIFDDVFPDRGNSYEETANLMKSYFTSVEEVSVEKGGLALADINNMKPVKFLEYKRRLEELAEEDFLEKVEKGKLQMATPYGVGFISKKTYGSSFLGLMNFPVDIYPSVFILDNFFDNALFFGEVFRGGIKIFGKIFEMKKYEGFDFFIIDYNTIMSFGRDVHKIVEIANKKSSNYFGIFSSFPSAYLPTTHRRFLSEIDDGICVNVTGTSALLEFF
ncbi:hypothetical protein DRP05_12215 [Archaeoglobales archaeon]|nr:MAG: hypothetical protein DRP05_12215 [Archaeoglobales archaeon]